MRDRFNRVFGKVDQVEGRAGIEVGDFPGWPPLIDNIRLSGEQSRILCEAFRLKERGGRIRVVVANITDAAEEFPSDILAKVSGGLLQGEGMEYPVFSDDVAIIESEWIG